jgi:hypothetical protein
MVVLAFGWEFDSQHITMLLVWLCIELGSSVFKICNSRVIGKFMKFVISLMAFIIQVPWSINVSTGQSW